MLVWQTFTYGENAQATQNTKEYLCPKGNEDLFWFTDMQL